ncbi:NlpC/P60 family protein [Maritimibacter dapengensis]|uniref:C40 family peptidase n=1 Tax=Maritimibacter dapengensis TaxID=2836868 RepID=A0ABS6SYM5_9RHOB|nr:C40 family peptidase [Maritimibacter dapengensis]
MTDRRLLRTNGTAAHSSLEGQVEAERFTDGTPCQVNAQSVAILASPRGPRERELITGEGFTVLDQEGRFSFGFAEKDGYVGWVFSDVLMPRRVMTHRVTAPRSFRKETPDIKAWEPVFPLSYGAQVEVADQDGTWSLILMQQAPTDDTPAQFVVPTAHLAPLGVLAEDPVAEAEKLLGTPYLWGGNSSFGIDCSGLVQVAWQACGVSIGPDSDLQAQSGAETDALSPSDLMFWKGHVAMIADETRLIHANVHHMAVAFEEIDAAVARIEAQGDGPVTAIRRITRPSG